MRPELLELLRELEAFGKANDAASGDRRQKMLNITHDTGVFLSVLIQAGRGLGVGRVPPGVGGDAAVEASCSGATVAASGSSTLVSAHGASAPHCGHTRASGSSATPQEGQSCTPGIVAGGACYTSGSSRHPHRKLR